MGFNIDPALLAGRGVAGLSEGGRSKVPPPTAGAVHGLILHGWHPARLNELLGHWGPASKRKKRDRQLLAAIAAQAGTPKAAGKRRVGLRIVLGPKQRAGDADAYWKSLLDAMKHCGLILDDNRQNVELEPVRFDRDEKPRTEIVLTDL
jgi:Holliday junction resolvase RusA-like endonuclease